MERLWGEGGGGGVHYLGFKVSLNPSTRNALNLVTEGFFFGDSGFGFRV